MSQNLPNSNMINFISIPLEYINVIKTYNLLKGINNYDYLTNCSTANNNKAFFQCM